MELQCKSREELQQLAWLRVRWMGMHIQIKPPVIGGRACKRFGPGGGGGRPRGRRGVCLVGRRWCRSQAVAVLAGAASRCSACGGGGGRRAERDRGGRKKGWIRAKDPCPWRWRTSETCPIMLLGLRPQPLPYTQRDSKFRAPSCVCVEWARGVCVRASESERGECALRIALRNPLRRLGGFGPGLLPETVTSLELSMLGSVGLTTGCGLREALRTSRCCHSGPYIFTPSASPLHRWLSRRCSATCRMHTASRCFLAWAYGSTWA
jgi:hypothetical protein